MVAVVARGGLFLVALTAAVFFKGLQLRQLLLHLLRLHEGARRSM